MNTLEIRRKAENLLKELNAGDGFKADKSVKIQVLKAILPELNLRIGQYINRHNKAGDSYNKIIGFMINWQNDGDFYYILEEEIHIICDRVKRYNRSYSSFNNKLEFYHGEIWALPEVLAWRERGDLIEDTPEAKAEFDKAKQMAVKSHECCFVDKMLTW